MKSEIRQTPGTPATITGRTLAGIAIPYNSDSLDLGGFVERFLPGSVADTIRSNQIEAWAHHDRTKPLASQASGTLRLTDTPQGLRYEMDLPQNNTDADNLISLASGPTPVIGGTSFGFAVDADGQRWSRARGTNLREILTAQLEHISPVVTPAYPQTSAVLRSLHSNEVEDTAVTYGIDLDKLAGVFVAQAKGLEVSEDEMILARSAIDILAKTIRTPKLKAATDRMKKILL